MKLDPEQLAAARAVGDLLRADRRAADLAFAAEFGASERAFQAMMETSSAPTLFARALAWLEGLELPDLLVLAPAAVRGEVGVRKLADEEPGEVSLAAGAGAKVEIAFENHHSDVVWVVACERADDGTVSFVPEKDLSDAPRVDPGDALTFAFTPASETTMRVVAIALKTRPQGDPAKVLAEPARLQEFGVVATARFTLRVSPPAK